MLDERMSSCVKAICDAIKQNESELANINLKIQPNKADNFFCFIVFTITQNAIFLENKLPNLHGVFTKLKLHGLTIIP